MGRVPDPTLRIAGGIMGRELKPRQFVFGDHDPGRSPLRARLHHEVWFLGIRTAGSGEEMRKLRFLCGRQAARIADVDQGRPGPVGHAEDDLRPGRLIVVVAKNLLIFVAEIAIDGERLLVFPGPRQVREPFRSGQLRLDHPETAAGTRLGSRATV